MSASFDEPAIPPRLRRPLAALWISLGLHAAVIALVQVAPPASTGTGESVIEARLVSTPAEPAVAETPPITPAAETPDETREDLPPLAPSEAAEALPVAEPLAPPSARPAPSEAPPPASAAAPSAAPAATPGAAITSAVDLTYYGWRDRDTSPIPLHKIKPTYPAEADRQNVPGCVVLRLKHEADGRVSDVEVISVTPRGYSFETSAQEAFRNAPFSPAFKQGRPVRALQEITVQFDSDDGRRVTCGAAR